MRSWRALLWDLMYKTPSDDTIRKCIITKEAVEGTGEPQIVHGEAPAQPVDRQIQAEEASVHTKGHSGNSLMKGFDYK